METKYQAGTRVSEYVLEAPLGAGAFGEVWRARHHVWAEQRVAVKLPIQPEYVRFLQREGIVVHGVQHANVVRVLGLDPFAETPYLIMELIDGPSLHQVIAEHAQGVPIQTARLILRGILAAMKAAHSVGVLHRDLKPGNVLLNQAGRPLADLRLEDVKVSDFGLGVDSGDTLRSIAQSVSMDRDNQIVGTLAYMAPEVRENQRKHDARSDLYSIGVILFELLTGERPAGAEYPSTLRSDVPAEMDNIFRKLYARYDRRYESAAAVLADLDAGPTVAGAANGSAGSFRVMLQDAGDSPISVIKAIRETTGLGLAEAKQRVDHAPSVILDGVSQSTAYQAVQALENAGARVWLFADGRRVAISRVTPPPLPSDATREPRCPSCQANVARGDQFCTACGRQLAAHVRRCPSCQGYPGPGDRFCIFCGAGLTPAPLE